MKQKLQYITLIIVIIAIILIFYLSLGKIDFAKQYEERQKRIHEIKKKTEELNESKDLKIKRKLKLDKDVKHFFYAARIFIGLILIFLNCVLFKFLIKPELVDASCHFNFNHTISLLVDYNAIALSILLLLFFIIYESAFEIKDLKKRIHLQIRRIIYRNDKGLENEIIELDNQIKKLEEELKTLQ